MLSSKSSQSAHKCAFYYEMTSSEIHLPRATAFLRSDLTYTLYGDVVSLPCLLSK